MARANGICMVCPPGSQFNPILQQCITVSMTGMMPQPYPPSFSTNCGSNGFWDAPSQCCKCSNSYVWIMGGCQQQQTCYPNSQWIGNGCTCNYGFINMGSQCQMVTQTPYCPPNSRFNGLNCQCNPGYFPVNGNR
jgi:hypothetical protein